MWPYLIVLLSGIIILLAVLAWNCRQALTKARKRERVSTLTADELRTANQNLGVLIARHESELREAVRSALGATEIEMRRVGREIHDSLCQELVGLLRMTHRKAYNEKTGDVEVSHENSNYR
jgi:signal transduction histidine kinase